MQYGNGSGSVNLYMAHGGSSWGFWSGTPALHTCLLGLSQSPLLTLCSGMTVDGLARDQAGDALMALLHHGSGVKDSVHTAML